MSLVQCLVLNTAKTREVKMIYRRDKEIFSLLISRNSVERVNDFKFLGVTLRRTSPGP